VDECFFLVLAHPASPGQNPESRKTVVCVCVCVCVSKMASVSDNIARMSTLSNLLKVFCWWMLHTWHNSEKVLCVVVAS